MESPNEDTHLAVLSSHSPTSKLNLKDLLDKPIDIDPKDVLKLFSDIIHAFINAGFKSKIKAALRESRICSDFLLNLCSDTGRSIV